MSQQMLPKGWVETKLGAVIELKYGKSLPKKIRDEEGAPVYGSNGIVGYHSDFMVEGPGIIVGRKGSNGAVHYSAVPFFPIDTTYYVNEVPGGELRYWFYQLRDLPLQKTE
jgi:type I restriction enzyme S subunit